MISRAILGILIVGGVLSISISYVYGDAFTDIQVSGVSTFTNDLVFDRPDFPNSIVQGQTAFDNGRDLTYQKVGGGPMSGYIVRANTIGFSGGPVGIGTETPAGGLALDVNGVSQFNNDLIFDRADANNSIVQGINAFNNGRDLVYQKAGGGPMSGFTVFAATISFDGGNVGLGTATPAERLDVNGNIRLTGNIVSPGAINIIPGSTFDVCIGLCP